MLSFPFDIKSIRENNSNSMIGETLNANSESSVGTPAVLPRNLLYSIFARIGGHGLDTDSFEALRASYRGKFLGKAIAYDNRQHEIPSRYIQSLRWHPVRLLSFLDRPYYYGAKKKYLDWIGSRHLESGRYDFFHSWSGDCLETLRVAKRKRIPSLIEIPTWHRGSQGAENRGQRPEDRKNWKSRFLLERERFLEEYDLATLVVVLSEKAAESFRVAGFPDEKLFYLPRGVDTERFKPASEPDGRKRPPIFRAIFSGALIERKGIHHLLEAWHRLNLSDAELWLLGSVHEEAKPHLRKFARDNVRVLGFKPDLENYLNQGTVYVFPSRLEGSAKTIYEAAASGLPMITTREAGDVVRDGVEGIIFQPGNVDAIAAAIEHLYRHPEIVASMSAAARQRVVENFTWDHYRSRLLGAYERAIQLN